MMLEEIAARYGMGADYYDNIGGRIYHLVDARYDAGTDTTIVPVSEGGQLIGTTRMEGNWCGEHKQSTDN